MMPGCQGRSAAGSEPTDFVAQTLNGESSKSLTENEDSQVLEAAIAT